MFNLMKYPADAELYEAAKNYVACEVVVQHSDTAGIAAQRRAAQKHSHLAFSALLLHHCIEPTKELDIYAIAAELCDYAEREGF